MDYHRKAWRDWYNRNKDNEEFKQKIALKNAQNYLKKKQSKITVIKLDENNKLNTDTILEDKPNIEIVQADKPNIEIVQADKPNIEIVQADKPNICLIQENDLALNLIEIVHTNKPNICLINKYKNMIKLCNEDDLALRLIEIKENNFKNELFNLINDDEALEWDLKRGDYVKNNFASEKEIIDRKYSRRSRNIKKTSINYKKLINKMTLK